MKRNSLAARAETVEIFELARRHGAEDLAAQAVLMGQTRAQFETSLLGRIYLRQVGGAFSFARLVRHMADGKLDGIERETLEEAARVAGKPFDAYKPEIPWAAFTRDLTKSSAGAGGFLVGAEVAEAQDILRPWSTVTRAGITMLERLVGDVLLPRTAAKATGFWLPTEGTAIAESQPTLGMISMTPKQAGGFCEFSRQLMKQANVEAYVRRELLRTLGSVLDVGVLTGSGAAGQPLGLLNTPGLVAQSGTTLGHAGTTNMKQQCASANAPDEALVFLTTPEVRELLENRERATGSGFVWDDEMVASRPGYVTTDMPAATMVAGAWLDVIVGLWGSGFAFEINPYDPTAFKAGIIQARVLVPADVAVVHPSSWCVATAIT